MLGLHFCKCVHAVISGFQCRFRVCGGVVGQLGVENVRLFDVFLAVLRLGGYEQVRALLCPVRALVPIPETSTCATCVSMCACG
jgi:hypothetical protein